MTDNADRERGVMAEHAGLVALVIGAAVLLGQFGRIEALVVWPGQDRVATTVAEALALILAGAALCAPPTAPWRRRLSAVLALAVLALALGAALEILLDTNLGLDAPSWHEWAADQNPRPGRMGPISALALGCFALAVLLSQGSPGRMRTRLIALVVTATCSAGVLAILGSFMTLDFLYTWHGVTRTSLGGAVAVTSLGYGSYLRCRQTAWWRATWRRTGSGAVIVVTAVTLSSATLVAGLLAFALMQSKLEEQARQEFTERADNQAVTIETLLAGGLERAELVADTAGLAEIFPQAGGQRRGAAALDRLAGIARTVIAHNFNAVRFVDASGVTLTEIGAFEDAPRMKLAVHAPFPAWVGYGRNGFYLDVQVPILAANQPVGSALLEEPLPGLTRANDAATDWGATGEAALCGPVGDAMGCFPTRFTRDTFIVSRRRAGQPRPMSLALDGKTGVTKLVDHREERTLAAYGPVGATGLGFVIKMDLAEIYGPIRRGFALLLPVLALVVMVGVALLRARLDPLMDDMAAAQLATAENELRFRAASETSLDAFFILEAVRDGEGQIVDFRVSYVNRNGERLIGRPRERIIGESIGRALPTAVAGAWLERYRRVVTTGRPAESEVRLEDPGNAPRWIRQRIVQLGDGLALTVRDISERKLLEEQLSLMAQIDSLTGLPNRALFMDRLQRAMLRHGRRGALCALFHVDVDDLKHINEAFGHAAGDAVLRTYAERLEHAVRSEDTVARTGGDEFAVILEGLSSRAEALRSAEALLAALRLPVEAPERSLKATASIGLAFYFGQNLTPEQLLERAERLAADARRAGRNAYRAAELPATAGSAPV